MPAMFTLAKVAEPCRDIELAAIMPKRCRVEARHSPGKYIAAFWGGMGRSLCRCRKNRKKGGKLTSRHDPNTTLAERKLVDLHACSANLDHNLARVDKKHHLHLATVLGAFKALRRQLYDASAEERYSHDLGILEIASGHVTGDDRCSGKSKIYTFSQPCLSQRDREEIENSYLLVWDHWGRPSSFLGSNSRRCQ